MAVGEAGTVADRLAFTGVLEIQSAGALAIVRAHRERVTRR